MTDVRGDVRLEGADVEDEPEEALLASLELDEVPRARRCRLVVDVHRIPILVRALDLLPQIRLQLLLDPLLLPRIAFG